jgi:hypothetical protein
MKHITTFKLFEGSSTYTKMKKLIAKIRNTRDYENLKERLGKELGTLIYQLVDEADKADLR